MRVVANVSIVIGLVLLIATTLFMMTSLALIVAFGVGEGLVSAALPIAMAPLGMIVGGVLVRRAVTDEASSRDNASR